MFKRYLLHKNLWVRFGALLSVVTVIFIGVWAVSYGVLPEGLLRGRSAGALLAGGDLAGGSFWLEWGRIFAINLGVLLLLMVAPNLLASEQGYPLGYSTVIITAVFYAITLGTNSFTLSQGGKIPPTWMVLTRSGPYEIAAYVLAAVASYSLPRYQLIGRWPQQKMAPVTSTPTRETQRALLGGVALAILILLAANGLEAYRVMQYFAS